MLRLPRVSLEGLGLRLRHVTQRDPISENLVVTN